MKIYITFYCSYILYYFSRQPDMYNGKLFSSTFFFTCFRMKILETKTEEFSPEQSKATKIQKKPVN